MGNKLALTLALAVAGIAVAHAGDDLSGTWIGRYACGQHRFQAAHGPFEWQLPFEVQNGKVTARRDYMSINTKAAVATFTGRVQPDGLVEIAVNGRQEGDSDDAFRGTYTGHANGDGIAFTGPMFAGTGSRVVRQCELTLRRSRARVER